MLLILPKVAFTKHTVLDGMDYVSAMPAERHSKDASTTKIYGSMTRTNYLRYHHNTSNDEDLELDGPQKIGNGFVKKFSAVYTTTTAVTTVSRVTLLHQSIQGGV
ncbi:hypothetical protein Trydic_g22516 [Trypoxylus dichotomus]